MNGQPLSVSDREFDREVLQSPLPVLVDFWAEWCGPCRMVGPLLDQIARDMAGRLKVAKVNIDQNPETPEKYGIRSIPSLLLFKGGKLAAQQTGALPRAQLEAWVNSALQS